MSDAASIHPDGLPGLAAAFAGEASSAAHPFSGRDLTPEHEAHVFLRLRGRLIVTSVDRLFSTSRLRVALVGILSFAFWGGLYVLFLSGFLFLNAMAKSHVQAIYNVFFASLTLMLIFSSSIILYSGLYRTPEVTLLLTLPIRAQRVFAYKFQEAIWFSSWGFILLGSPMLVAYGVATGAAWYYYALLLPFIVSFVYIPASIGAILCLVVVYFAPSIRTYAIVILGVLLALGAVWLAWSIVAGSNYDILTKGWLDEMSGRLRFAEQRMLPSWWLSMGLLETAEPPSPELLTQQSWRQGVLFLALLISNALFFQLVAVWVAGKLYRTSYSRLLGERVSRRRARPFWLDRLAMAMLWFLPRPMRLLIVKDLRLFRRDPVQWTQFAIFFGLLALYFLNIRRFSYDVNYTGWVNMIGFLNLAVVGLILSTFTTRFIFPMVSIEGQRFWVLGLLPVKRDTILWAKFVFATLGSAFPCATLILVSDLMLSISLPLAVLHQVACLALCIGLSAIAVGLGARMPDLREQSPSKIAAGFGGTLNLVLSAAYIVATIAPTALISYYSKFDPTGETFRMGGWQFDPTIAYLTAGAFTVAAAIIASWLPLRAGLSAFRRLEF